jgi:pyruvate/2-oxoglutarate dehydrogenase complex dihydrolipoamide dehydrogenase (E3) component
MAHQSTELRPDICVIGAGAGGLAAAAGAAAMGVPVVLIEKGRMGGESVSGAFASKIMLAAAERADAFSDSVRFGVKSGRSGIDFAAVNAQLRRVINAVSPQISCERLTGLGVRVIAGTASFADPRTVTVGDIAIKARRFIVATGSVPVIPSIPGLAEAPYLTGRTILGLSECPRHLAIIGAGSVGLELAQTFRRLGSEVTVLEAATPLWREDPECAAIVLNGLADEGIRLHAGVRIASVRRALSRIRIGIAAAAAATDEDITEIEVSHLLVAAGRRPNVEDLHLDAAGIRHEPQGIRVNSRLRTSNRRVYAIGDVIGGPRSVHAAGHHAGLVLRNALLRQPVRIEARSIPRVTHTDPELAQVGLLEDEARKVAGAIRILRWPYRENDRAVTTQSTDGHIKVVTNRRGKILGATIVGAAASENIAAWALAVSQRLDVGVFAGLITPYPSYAEVGKRAAISYYMSSLTSIRVRRIIGWLRRLG